MPIYKGNWLDEEGHAFLGDCYEKHDPFGGPRFARRPHDTKRRRRPGKFPCQGEFGSVARDWKRKLTAAERLLWSKGPLNPYTRKLSRRWIDGNRQYMNHNGPLCHAKREQHHEEGDYYPYVVTAFRLMEVDTDFNKLRCDITYTGYEAEENNGTVHFFQVHPSDIDKGGRWRYARYMESHDLETDKFYPDYEVDEFWLSMCFHAEPGETVQIYLRISEMYSNLYPPNSLDGITESYLPIYYKITA